MKNEPAGGIKNEDMDSKITILNKSIRINEKVEYNHSKNNGVILKPMIRNEVANGRKTPKDFS